MLKTTKTNFCRAICDYFNCSDGLDEQYPHCSEYKKGACPAYYLYNEIFNKWGKEEKPDYE